MIIASPLIIIYILRRKGFDVEISQFITFIFIGIIFLNVPFLGSVGFVNMVLNTEK